MADPETHGLKTPPRKTRRVLRLIACNVLFTFIGLGFIALGGEVYLRLKTSTLFGQRSGNSILGAIYLQLMTPYFTGSPPVFVQGVGLILKPNVEVLYINDTGFFVISRTNSLGFRDREPIRSERAAESCHIAMIGDSFVDAIYVPIADKFHVRLEELATQKLPYLDITTSAFGRRGTGQINQLPYYDEFARHLSPKLIVLVFVRNDFWNNSPILSASQRGYHPDRQPYVTATRDENGTMKLRPPYPDWQRFKLPQFHYRRVIQYLHWSFFVRGLQYNISTMFPSLHDSHIIARVKFFSGHPAYESLFNRWQPNTWSDIRSQFNKKPLLPAFEKELAFTAFALDQFKERTERDGTSLVILASHDMGTRGHARFDHMSALAAARGIPVIDQYDYIRRQGADPERDARWARDYHWNEQGHQWAAEALLEYLEENPEICTPKKTP